MTAEEKLEKLKEILEVEERLVEHRLALCKTYSLANTEVEKQLREVRWVRSLLEDDTHFNNTLKACDEMRKEIIRWQTK